MSGKKVQRGLPGGSALRVNSGTALQTIAPGNLNSRLENRHCQNLSAIAAPQAASSASGKLLLPEFLFRLYGGRLVKKKGHEKAERFNTHF
jgi:hypothetical protein